MSMGGNTNIERYGVEAVFENDQFEKNIKTTMNSLEDFEKALQLEGSSKGIEDLQKSFSSLSDKLDPIADSVSALEKRFSMFGTAAGRVIENLVDRAVRAGQKIIESLTIDPIKTGWTKFEENTKNIGTIMAQGYDMSTVEDQMKRLMFFTDETSYQYSEMVGNISKFTAAGKGLEESVTAMQGIALWAGSAGVSAQKASMAMYQLSQAMGAGYMRKEDWKSIQTYNMDTREFREQALETAVALGKLKKTANDTYQSVINPKAGEFSISQFSEHLTQDKWFDSDVMMAVYEKYAAAVEKIYDYVKQNDVTASQAIEDLKKQASAMAEAYSKENNVSIEEATKALVEQGKIVDSTALKWFKASQEARTFTDAVDYVKEAVSTGWLKTFELIFGNYEEATELWTNLTDVLYTVFVQMNDTRNSILEMWKAFGGRYRLLTAIQEAFAAITRILKPVQAGFERVFKPLEERQIAKNLFEMTEKLVDFFMNLQIGEETAQALADVFEGVFSIVRLVIDGFKAAIKALLPLAKPMKEILGFVTQFLGDVGKVISEMVRWAEQSSAVASAVEKLGAVGRVVLSIFLSYTVISGIFDKISKTIAGINKAVITTPTRLIGSFKSIINGLKFIAKFLPIILAVSAAIAAFYVINKKVQQVFGSWSNLFDTVGKKVTGFLKAINPFGTKVKNAIGSLPQYFQNARKAVVDFATSFMQSFSFSDLVENAKNKVFSFASVVSEFGKTKYSEIKSGLGFVITAITEQFSQLPTYISNAFRAVSEFFSSGNAQNALSNSVGKILGNFESLKKFVEGFSTKAAAFFDKLANGIKSINSFDDLKRKAIEVISSFNGLEFVTKLLESQ